MEPARQWPKTPEQRFRDYQSYWVEMHHRYLRSLVPTRYGIKSGDPKLAMEYHTVNQHMNGILDAAGMQVEFVPAPEMVPGEQPTEEFAAVDDEQRVESD